MHARAHDHDHDQAARPPRTPLPSTAVRQEDGARPGVLDHRHTAGNAAVTAALRQGGHMVQRAPATTAAAPEPFVQGSFRFTNLDRTKAQYQEKAARVLDLLNRHSAINEFVGTRTCHITLEKRTADTPAEVKDRGADGVFVTLAAYYFEKYDVGYVMGMLAHEFSVHPLADAQGIAQEEKHLRGMPWPVPGLEDQQRGGEMPMMNTVGAKQPDHILAVIPSGPRYQIYRDTALEMARLLAQDARTRTPGASTQDVTDLLDCFLMDVASIAATNDDRMRARPLKWGSGAFRADIAKVYNAYKERLSTDLDAESPLRPLLPRNKDADAVYSDFTTLIGRALAGATGADSIQS
ncbi:hypothetical protein [Streptomyces sp. CRN 30]|uniref:hypothetical protein n=1 Tax=Streptomyces sp. CRN 30 TaxID=3075613 RepID=UPI002A838F36|nr:hypothetical protein [Streptomyces sp. CRN 30]